MTAQTTLTSSDTLKNGKPLVDLAHFKRRFFSSIATHGLGGCTLKEAADEFKWAPA